ncbi:helix-turn-helix domain-containing protein [Arthrobacter alpinus]|uniref:helix-turn-helix domain-containing protein n=1 Tax=Arthrobacter alpinus TaxID=656366 RepID=UPI000AA369C1|nr:AraC family transcriptional regulator [Arthrobacter alpinus]
MTSVLAPAPAAAPGKAGLGSARPMGAVRGPRAVPDPFLLTTGMMEQEEPYQWPPHSHDEHELIWSARGVVTILVDGRMWSVLPGTGLWIPRGVVHEGHMGGGVASRVTLFSPEAWTRGWKNTTAVNVNEAVQQLLVHLAHTGMPAEERLRAQQVCIDMLEPVESSNMSVPIPSDPRIRELVDSVLKDPSDDRSLEQWARRLNLSSRTITRTFGADVAMSFVHWRRLVRMRSAHGLLAQGMSVGAVGRRVGYGTTSAFVAAFRKVVGYTPGELLARD